MNCLGTVGRNCQTIDEKNLQAYALDDMLQSISDLYVPVDDPEDIWQGERVLQLIHGQGLTVPHELHNSWNKILFPVRIEDRVQAEQAIALEQCKHHTIDHLQVGYIHNRVASKYESHIGNNHTRSRGGQRFLYRRTFLPFISLCSSSFRCSRYPTSTKAHSKYT